ncbi:electron transfer flavoprotein, beta subunit [Sphaerochaeta pleomorpha str. Grapes]|uniref:Protein FixA n=1 Tax=Sphaerochaeta pleomorpha (strain ATCC BAA-1885 / DSM 22778 / Grapes) TaxID=158190 RepID=G8QT52_SPHPG|nr:electron transfer flavoprotein subunit beta/FixA family protein [Sphaerochaeta pleomorpha]AEV27957.1 electron transfer flavoprotein, beta subunit [Sphaerochaeta pleomorpha str. Grapes]
MYIVVPIKQVPETSNVQMDKETGTMIRSASEAIVNPLDLYALETALQIKERTGGRITVITMGPLGAAKVLKEAIAMGCDDAIHLSDRAFGGSDTWATSYTLASAIRKLGKVDLVIAGERATDGDTGQVGPGLASWLDMGLVTYTSHIEELTDTYLIAERLLEEGYQKVKATLPVVLTVVKEIAIPRLPTLKGKKRAMHMTIPLLGAKDLGLENADLGLLGSPTRVVKIESPKISRACTVVKATDDSSIQEGIDKLMLFLASKELLGKGVAK